MKKQFIITVDTEGDNLWQWKDGDKITTENARFLPRFQELCEQYGFKPTYLINYEMAQDNEWVKYASNKAKNGLCEIGMHIHAWNSPPEYFLENMHGGNPYITEYPADVIYTKVQELTKLLSEKFEVPIVSSRSGRWATNDQYFAALAAAEIKIDCSVTPELDLSNIPGCSCNCGNNYKNASREMHEIYPGIIEVPMTTKKIRWLAEGGLKHRIATIIRGEAMWLRPHKKSLRYLNAITSATIHKDKYLEFMIHSSELMPGGSPYFKNESDIDNLYLILQQYFKNLTDMGVTGTTLANYVEENWHENY